MAIVASACALGACSPSPATPIARTSPTSMAAPAAPAPVAPEPALAIAPRTDEPACEPVAFEPFHQPELPIEVDAPPVPLVSFGDGMDPFYEKLAALLRGHGNDHVRIAVYGDSNLTMDYPTGQMRRSLQARFGDGGHGYVALGQPWSHYQHMDVLHGIERGFKPYAISTDPTGDGGYGLSGIVVENEWQGGSTFVETAPYGSPVGTTVSSFEIFYLARPDLGSFEVRVDGEPKLSVDTKSEEGSSVGVARVDVEPGPHRADVVATSPSRIRLLGAVLETSSPGIVVDSFGVGALNTRAMAMADPALNKQMLAERKYDLIIFMTGANDVYTMKEADVGMRDIVAWQREALPGVPLLIMTPADRGRDETFSRTPLVVEQRKQMAELHGTLLWDLWAAMGGRDSMSRWYAAKLSHFDGVHFNQRGGAAIADRFLASLGEDFSRFLAKHPNAGCNPQIAASDGAPDGAATNLDAAPR